MSGFVDIQVNGYAGVDFNSRTSLTDQQAVEVCRRLSQDGVDRILATIITAPIDVMVMRIKRLAELIDQIPSVAERIAGIHVEGPFINPADGFVGAHPPSAVTRANQSDADRLLDAGAGHVRLVTLAPEMDAGASVTRALHEQGIVIAAGHCDPTLDQLRESADAGLKLFTHLGNGCPALLHRHDNIVQRVLSLGDTLMVSFIADGHHVPTFTLRNYLRCVAEENVVIVTDAISAAGLGPGRYELSDQIVEVDDDGAAWAACRTHFAGCATTMPTMVEILKREVGATDDQIEQWTVRNPARLLAQSPR